MTDVWHEGERLQIVRITDDPDSYRVIHLRGGYAFPCTRGWMDAERPHVGDYVTARVNRLVVIAPTLEADAKKG